GWRWPRSRESSSTSRWRSRTRSISPPARGWPGRACRPGWRSPTRCSARPMRSPTRSGGPSISRMACSTRSCCRTSCASTPRRTPSATSTWPTRSGSPPRGSTRAPPPSGRSSASRSSARRWGSRAACMTSASIRPTSTPSPTMRCATPTSRPTREQSARTMSAGSVSPPTERPGVDQLALERLIGVRSSKPSFYAAFRDKSARLDHTIETLERISSALCAAPAGPVAVCDAVVEAAAHHFDARWAAMVFSAEHAGVGMARVFVHASDGVIQRWAMPPRMLAMLTDQTLAAKGPVLADHDEELGFGGEPCVIVAAPMPVHGQHAGILVVGLPDGVEVAPSDVSILVTLANHAGVALHNASLFQENGRRASELERRGSELEGTLRRLEQAGRRQLLSEERNRIARELHDSVAQHLLTIGMNLEWCRRQESTSSAVLERVV